MAIRQIALVQHRRGREIDLPDFLEEAEIAMSVDTGSVFIGAPNVQNLKYRIRSESDIFPYGNIRLLSELSDNLNIINHVYQGNTPQQVNYPIIALSEDIILGVNLGDQLIINSGLVQQTVDLTTYGTTIENVASAINDANIPNIIASEYNSRLKIVSTANYDLILQNAVGTPLQNLKLVIGSDDIRTYSSTGMYSRTLQETLDDTLSAKAYGIIGDGDNDDTLLINHMFNDIYTKAPDPEYQRKILFPAGVYALKSEAIYLPPHAHLVGEGFASTIIRGYAQDKSVVSTMDSKGQLSTSGSFGLNGATQPEDIIIEKIGFEHEYDFNILSLDSVRNVTFRDCRFMINFVPSVGVDYTAELVNFVRNAVFPNGVGNIKFDNCIFQNGNIAVSSRTLSDYIGMEHCMFAGLDGHGVVFEGDLGDAPERSYVMHSYFNGFGSSGNEVVIGINSFACVAKDNFTDLGFDTGAGAVSTDKLQDINGNIIVQGTSVAGSTHNVVISNGSATDTAEIKSSAVDTDIRLSTNGTGNVILGKETETGVAVLETNLELNNYVITNDLALTNSDIQLKMNGNGVLTVDSGALIYKNNVSAINDIPNRDFVVSYVDNAFGSLPITTFISTDDSNELQVGTDNLLFVPPIRDINILDTRADELDTTKILAPDGSDGLVWIENHFPTLAITGGVGRNPTGDNSDRWALNGGATISDKRTGVYMDGVDNSIQQVPLYRTDASGFNMYLTLAFYRDIGTIEGLVSLESDNIETILFRRNANGTMGLWLSSNGTSFDIANNVPGIKTDWITDDVYNYRLYQTATEWKLDWSDDLKPWDDVTKTWTNDITVVSSLNLACYDAYVPWLFGGEVYTTNYWFKGSIKLTDTLMFNDNGMLIEPQTRNNFQYGLIVEESASRSITDTKNILVAERELDKSEPTDWMDGIVPPSASDQFPAMTSNILPADEKCWATNQYDTNYRPFEAFDKLGINGTACWITQLNVLTATILRAMTSNYPIDMVRMQPRYDTTNYSHAKNFRVVYTEDDMSVYSPGIDVNITAINYTTVLTVTGNSQHYGELKSFRLDSEIPTTATAWGIIIDDVTVVGSKYITIGRLEGIYTRATDMGVSVWADENTGSPRYMFDNYQGSNILGEKRKVCKTITDSDGYLIQGESHEFNDGSVQTEYKISVLEEGGTSGATNNNGLIPISAPAETLSKVYVRTLTSSSSNYNCQVNFQSYNITDSLYNINAGNVYAGQQKDMLCWLNENNELYRKLYILSANSWAWGTLGFTDPRNS